MTRKASLFSSWGHAFAFWSGCVAVTVGVLLHLPMFLMGRTNHFKLVGMPMGTGMYIGMGLIVAGFAAAAYGLMPRRTKGNIAYEEIEPPESAPLTRAHWIQIIVLATALIIDVMKAASLGFVIPGMRAEYGLSFAGVAVLPFFALLGTTLGSFLWGMLADLYGRRASILLAAVIFMGTSICGCMPSFRWNIFMCFVMGIGAGGMLPVAYALLAEIMPTRHRGWCLVLIGGIGSIGGYFATSMLSALLQPYFGWRIMWLINLPIALILIAVSPVLQESARFLQSMGRLREARETLARFGIAVDITRTVPAASPRLPSVMAPVKVRSLVGLTCALTLTALCVGFVNFGVLLWLPGSLMREGRSMGAASSLIARSTLIAAPTIVLAAWLYSIWSTKRTLILAVGVTTLGLIAIVLRDIGGVKILSSPVIPVALLIVGTSGIISMLLPYSAESYPLRVRGRATGWVAGFSKSGGLLAQGLGALALVPALGIAAGAVAVPCVLSMLLIFVLGRETHLRDLRELEQATVTDADGMPFGAD
ncbi:MAG TPA: MFS transporter [Edaphobacter sp.]|uniref:MFS transporter n=1 Tax=Edaphobacter sp. TaxID=1934404 RepID=UPI002B7FD850|nr:MFS transporter [Edaphobacter sp.]HUZ95900.1 MFS transporter [Edaphobacter sp.]